MPTAVSLFSGCGGSDAGVIKAGFTVLMANDIMTYAKDVYLANLPNTDYRLGDVTKIKDCDFPIADLLIGCYPCQGFSQGGAREANRKINTLYKEFARALGAIEPKAFIAENVSGLRRSTYEHLLKDQLGLFGAAGRHGYRVVWKELKAHEYGVAQERKRLVIVGVRGDLDADYIFPEPTHGERAGQPYVTIRQALDGFPEWPEGEFCDDPFHWYYLSRNRRRGWDEISKTIVAHMRHMPLHPISPVLKRIHTDQWEFSKDAPARRFSYREAARLQGFLPRYLKHGDEFVFPEACVHTSGREGNSLRYRYKVVGNAVPPPLFEAVARALPNVWD
jgi:DNA (cytosine-5)-methyltransferase 1